MINLLIKITGTGRAEEGRWNKWNQSYSFNYATFFLAKAWADLRLRCTFYKLVLTIWWASNSNPLSVDPGLFWVTVNSGPTRAGFESTCGFSSSFETLDPFFFLLDFISTFFLSSFSNIQSICQCKNIYIHKQRRRLIYKKCKLRTKYILLQTKKNNIKREDTKYRFRCLE